MTSFDFLHEHLAMSRQAINGIKTIYYKFDPQIYIIEKCPVEVVQPLF